MMAIPNTVIKTNYIYWRFHIGNYGMFSETIDYQYMVLNCTLFQLTENSATITEFGSLMIGTLVELVPNSVLCFHVPSEKSMI